VEGSSRCRSGSERALGPSFPHLSANWNEFLKKAHRARATGARPAVRPRPATSANGRSERMPPSAPSARAHRTLRRRCRAPSTSEPRLIYRHGARRSASRAQRTLERRLAAQSPGARSGSGAGFRGRTRSRANESRLRQPGSGQWMYVNRFFTSMNPSLLTSRKKMDSLHESRSTEPYWRESWGKARLSLTRNTLPSPTVRVVACG